MGAKEAKLKNNKLSNKRSTEAGVTLIELLVGMVLFLIVIGAIYGLLSIGQATRNITNNKVELMRNVRAALNIMGRDALNAGYSYNNKGYKVPDDFLNLKANVPVDADTTRDTLTSVIVGNDINPNSLQTSAAQNTDVVNFLYGDFTFNDSNSLSVTGASSGDVPGSVKLTVSGSTSSCKKYDLYLVENEVTRAVVMLTKDPVGNTLEFAPGVTDPLGANQSTAVMGSEDISILRPCGSDPCTNYPASLKRIRWVKYWVGNDGTLYRTVFGNNTGYTDAEQIQNQPLAYGIQNMQISYVLEDGTLTNDPGTAANLALVRQVKVTVTARSSSPDPRNNEYLIETITATFSTRNIEYDAG